MLSDPLLVKPSIESSDVGSALSYAITDPGAEPGRTIRTGLIGGFKSTITISRSSTKENKPYGTNRVSIRLGVQKPDTNGVLVEAFVQCVIGLPKAVFTTDDLNSYSVHLLSLLLFGDNASSGHQSGVQGDAFRDRLMAGEG